MLFQCSTKAVLRSISYHVRNVSPNAKGKNTDAILQPLETNPRGTLSSEQNAKVAQLDFSCLLFSNVPEPECVPHNLYTNKAV